MIVHLPVPNDYPSLREFFFKKKILFRIVNIRTFNRPCYIYLFSFNCWKQLKL